MSRSTDQQPATVPETATQAGPTDRWWWVEPTVWTQRMLTALEKGVKGGMWPSSLAERLLCRAGVIRAG